MATCIFNACKKDQPITDSQNSDLQITSADNAVVGRILEFRRKLEYKKAYPMYKSDEIVTIDDARLDVETNFNATYAFPDEKYIKTKVESIIVELPITDAVHTTVDYMLALYDECFAKVLEKYNNCYLEDKELMFISLKKGEITNGKLQLNLNITLGTKLQPGYNWTPFGNEDNWLYGYYWGNCDGISGIGSDAAEQIQEMINANRPIYWISPPYRFVYTMDADNPYQYNGDEFISSGGNNLIFYISKNTSDDFTSEEMCLNTDEMNFHYNGEHEVIYDLVPATNNKPSNWEFIGCNIEGRYEVDEEIHFIQHFNQLEYAYRNIVLIGDIGIPISISEL